MSDDNLLRSLNNPKSGKIGTGVFAGVLLLMLVLGIGAGYFANSLSGSTTTSNKSSQDDKESGKKSAGVMDKKQFPDEVSGQLKEGGIEGEGSFHLERPGGESQNVYLTSSTVDLSAYVGKKVKVLGATQKAQKAGWLMDVGYIEVL